MDYQTLKRRMLGRLKDEFKGLIAASDFDFEAESAIYWYASDHHTGQGDPLYQILSMSEFRPGPSHRSVKQEGEIPELMYGVLQRDFGSKRVRSMKFRNNPPAAKNPPSFIVVDAVTGRVGYTKRASGMGNEAISSCAAKAREIARKTGHSQIVVLELMKRFVGQELNVGMLRVMGITEEVHPDGSVTRNNPRRRDVRRKRADFRGPGMSGRIGKFRPGAGGGLTMRGPGYTASSPKKVRRNVFTFNNPASGPADTIAARELELYINNDSQLYHSQFIPIVKNLMLKRRRGVYDTNKAVTLFMYLMDAGAKKYLKEFGTGGKIDSMFNRNTRLAAAKAFRHSFEVEAELGNYDRLIGPVSNPMYRARFLTPDMKSHETRIRAHGINSALKKAHARAERLPKEFTAPRSSVEVERDDVRKNIYALNNPDGKSGMAIYEVFVGNIGRVYFGDSHTRAVRTYEQYVNYSQRGIGSAAGEDVSMITEGELSREHFGSKSRRGGSWRASDTRNNPRQRPHNEMERGAALVGLLVTTWAPGDGMTRYRFFKADGKNRYADYHQGGALYTANGRKDAIAFIKSYGVGRSRMNPLTRDEAARAARAARHYLDIGKRAKKHGYEAASERSFGTSDGFAQSIAIFGKKHPAAVRVGHKLLREAANLSVGLKSNPCSNPVCRNPKHKHVRKNPLLQTILLANPPVSDQWDRLSGRQRLMLLEFVGFEDNASRYLRLPWKMLSDMVKQALEQYWRDSSPRGTTRRYAAPVGARNPLTRREAGSVLREARRDVRYGSGFRAGDFTRTVSAGQAFGKSRVVHKYGPKSARRAAAKIAHRTHKMAGTIFSNPGSVRLPKPGTKMTVSAALDLAQRIGDRGLIEQCRKALKLQKAANKDSKCVIWKTFAMGSKDKIDSVVALTHYGDSPETMYKPPPGSKKGNHMYRHTWGEKGGKRSVPLLASADGKMLLMPLEGRKVAGDWLRH